MFNLIGRSLESLYQVGRGLKTVFSHTFRPPITKEYPDQMPELAATFRGRLALAVNPQTGDHLCISCLQCERVCPDKCIQITSHKSPETNKPELIEFKIDHGLCMFCGLCTEVCPTNCIINTNDFEMADYTRESLVYDLKKLTLTQDESTHYYDKKQLPPPKPKAKPAPKPAAKPATEAASGPAEAKPEAKAASAQAEAKAASAPAEAKPEAEAASAPAEVKPEAKPAAKPKAKPAAKTESTSAETKAEETDPDSKSGSEKETTKEGD